MRYCYSKLMHTNSSSASSVAARAGATQTCVFISNQSSRGGVTLKAKPYGVRVHRLIKENQVTTSLILQSSNTNLIGSEVTVSHLVQILYCSFWLLINIRDNNLT